ncbi:MAG: nucleoside deaminase [Bacilli bacterium]|nr:nucleoside deaminase [Bacilli bacterium]MDD4298043.1 nucleoside deaminase [Bacilli bacterium]
MEEKYMKIALQQARTAFNNGDVPVGAVIVKNGEIISRAYNRRERDQDATAHAEIIAIKKACRRLNSWRLNDCVMYVTLEPCSMCMGAIQQSRISKVVYGTKNIKEASGLLQVEYNNLFEDESAQLLQTFFQNRRN